MHTSAIASRQLSQYKQRNFEQDYQQGRTNRERVPLISVVTVVKDDAAGLAKTLCSVLAQTISPDDLDVVVMDGSSLASVRACVLENVRVSNRHRIRHICESDTGIYYAMNNAIVHANGLWLLFLNTGDVFSSGDVLVHMARVLSALDAHKQDCTCVAADFYEDWNGQKVYKSAQSPKRMPCSMSSSHQALFMRTNIARNILFDVSYKVCADAHQFARALLQGNKVCIYHYALCVVNACGFSTKNVHLMMKEKLRMQRELYPGFHHALRMRLYIAASFIKRYIRAVLPEIMQRALRLIKHWNVKKQKLSAGRSVHFFSTSVKEQDFGRGADDWLAPASTDVSPKSTPKKRVLWLTTALDESAVSKIFFLIAPQLCRHCEIVFVAIAPPSSEKAVSMLEQLDIKFISLNCKKHQVKKAARMLVSYVEREGADIIHAHLGRAYIAAALAKMRLQKTCQAVAYLATFHNVYSYFSLLTRVALRMLLPAFDSISAISQACLQSYKKLISHASCKNIAASVIYNPVEYVPFPDNPYDRAITGRAEAPVLLCASRFARGKGHEHALRMFSLLIKKYPKARMFFAGDGSLKAHFERIAVRAGLADSVKFLGNTDAVHGYMKHADLVVFPSQSEGFGLVPCEAFLQKTPVVMQDTELARELFVHDSWLVQCQDAVLFCDRVCDMLERRALYKNYAKDECAAISSRYNADAIAVKYVNWYCCRQVCS